MELPSKQALMESNPRHRDAIAERMRLPAENFASGYMRATWQEQTFAYQRLLLHILFEIKSLGFKMIVVGAGHYSLLDHVRAACPCSIRPAGVRTPGLGVHRFIR